MNYIEYIQIFISLVLGLAFTRIITSYAVIIKNAKRIKFYWPYFPISLGLLLFVINDFWTGFERSKLLTIGSGLELKLTFVLALIAPLSYTIRDITAARKTAYFLGAFNVSYTFIRSLSMQASTAISAQSMRLIMFTIFTIGVFSKNELIQKCIAVLFFLIAIAWFLFENTY